MLEIFLDATELNESYFLPLAMISQEYVEGLELTIPANLDIDKIDKKNRINDENDSVLNKKRLMHRLSIIMFIATQVAAILGFGQYTLTQAKTVLSRESIYKI